MKKLLNKLLFPQPLIVLLCVALTVVLMVLVFATDYVPEAFFYVIYAFSAYSLCILLAYLIPNVVSKIKKLLSKIPIMNRYLNDNLFRAQTSIYISLISNTAYSVFYAVMAFVQKSYWQMALAIYNLVLTVMRFMLIKRYNSSKKMSDNQKLIYEQKTYKFCGILMLLMSTTMTGLIELLISEGKKASGEILTITIAVYTFYCFIIAIVNIVKFKKESSLIFLASKNVCLARALMSLFSLQISMFSQFGGMESNMEIIMNIALGLIVCMTCAAMAVIMIVKSNKALKKF